MSTTTITRTVQTDEVILYVHLTHELGKAWYDLPWAVYVTRSAELGPYPTVGSDHWTYGMFRRSTLFFARRACKRWAKAHHAGESKGERWVYTASFFRRETLR